VETAAPPARARKPPVNHKSQAQRDAEWVSAKQEGIRNGATAVGDKYLYLRLVCNSKLPAMQKLVAHTVCTHGHKNGQRIFPSVRVLATESSLAERSVCKQIDALVRAGWLSRERAGRGKKWAMTIYSLMVPKVMLDAHSAERQSARKTTETDPARADGRSARDSHEGADSPVDGADSGAARADPSDVNVLTERQSSSSFLVPQFSNPEECATLVADLRNVLQKKDEEQARQQAIERRNTGLSRARTLVTQQPGFTDTEVARILQRYRISVEEVKAIRAEAAA